MIPFFVCFCRKWSNCFLCFCFCFNHSFLSCSCNSIVFFVNLCFTLLYGLFHFVIWFFSIVMINFLCWCFMNVEIVCVNGLILRLKKGLIKCFFYFILFHLCIYSILHVHSIFVVFLMVCFL